MMLFSGWLLRKESHSFEINVCYHRLLCTHFILLYFHIYMQALKQHIFEMITNCKGEYIWNKILIISK